MAGVEPTAIIATDNTRERVKIDMTIFLHSTQLLTHYTQYAIMNTVDSHKGGKHADNARKVLDTQGVSRTLQGVRRVNQEIHQKEATQSYPRRRQFTNCRYCLARVFEQAEQVVSTEANNDER